MNEPLVFLNVGWMNRYAGVKNDPTIGGHKWLKEHDRGHEAWNFLPYRGKLYGFVPARINIERLSANKHDAEVNGVTVVWVARSPRDKITYVVGWYRNASIHSDATRVRRASDAIVPYQIVTDSADAKLLMPDQRILKIPTAKAKGNFGQKPIWYGNDSFNARVRKYIEAGGVQCNPAKKVARGTPRQPDTETRLAVESAAVNHATEYYSSVAGGSRTVTSFEKDNVGWDLTVTGGDVTLKVEVKGLSGKELRVELSPNEYQKMCSGEHREAYVIYVVTEALTASAAAHVFYYNAMLSARKKHVWATEDGRILKVEEVTGARLTVGQ